jgi:Family of unknown function (DUF6346)
MTFSRASNLLIGIVLLPFSILIAVTAGNVGQLSHGERASKTVVRTGKAAVETCERHGPISGYGLGIWTTCDITVTWADGTIEQRKTDHGLFTADEQGGTFEVGEIHLGNKGGEGYQRLLVRDARPQNGAYIAAMIALYLTAFVTFCLSLERLSRWWRRT